MCKTRTISSVPEEERWDRAAIEEVKFTPWMIKERSAREEHYEPQEKKHKTSADIEINKEIGLEVKLSPRSAGSAEGCFGCRTAMLGGKASLTASSAA